jgi:cation/acetate symporter
MAKLGASDQSGELQTLHKAVALAEAEIAKLGSATTSLVGLEAPWFPLRNPGLVSIPLGFLAVFIGSLCYRDRRAEDMWEELYVRSNTGIGRSGVSSH